MKPLFIISCPIDTYSGYGARSRDLVRAIIELDKYNVKVLPQRWGSCPWGFIENNLEEWGFIQPHLLPPGNQLPAKPQVWAQISVPNEFQPVGEYNIGITAGIETTVCDPSWIQGLNRMDLNLVSSNHSKNTFENLRFEHKEGDTPVEIYIEKPIEVLFEGADLIKYFPSKETNKFDLKDIKDQFAYLFVGHWMQGVVGEDRKNVGLMIKLFYETFKNQKKTPALILKTSGAGASYMDREMILDKIDEIKKTIEADTLPNIYLLHGELTDEEMNNLYNHKKVKAMISLTKGEGFGRPLLEFSLTKKPIITTNWSGHIDFLDSKFTTLLEGKLTKVHDSALVKNILLKEGSWFSVEPSQAVSYLKDVFDNYPKYKKQALLQYHKSKNHFSYGNMKQALEVIMEEHLPDVPNEISLKLPKLKKLENVER